MTDIIKAAKTYRREIAKLETAIEKAEDGKLLALARVSNQFELYNDSKGRMAFAVEVWGEGRAAASRRAEANKIMITAPFYGEMKAAYKMHAKADDSQTKPRMKDYILKLATQLRKADEFDRKDAVAAEVYMSMITKAPAGKAKPVNVDHLIRQISKLTAAQKRKILAALQS